MNSGVYVLRFGPDYFYIGKADDIPRRWDQHRKDFLAGKHTKKMQWAYDTFGMPDFIVQMECHSDHIDLLESICIRHNWSEYCLNGNKPKEVPYDEAQVLINNADLTQLSTATQKRRINTAESQVLDATEQLDTLREQGVVLPDKERAERQALESRIRTLNQELHALKNRGFFARLFNL